MFNRMKYAFMYHFMAKSKVTKQSVLDGTISGARYFTSMYTQ